MSTVVPRVPNFRPFRSTISRFQDIAHFRNFPLTPVLKFHKVFNFRQIAKISISLYTLITALFVMKFRPEPMKTVGGVTF